MKKDSNSREDKFNLGKFKTIERELDDVMELIDIDVIKNKLIQVEKEFKDEPDEINKARLGIVYHEVALNLSFFSKTEYKGYAIKSFDRLTELFNSDETTKKSLCRLWLLIEHRLYL